MIEHKLWSDDADEAFDIWYDELFAVCSDAGAGSEETIACMRDLLQSAWRSSAMWCVQNPPPGCLKGVEVTSHD